MSSLADRKRELQLMRERAELDFKRRIDRLARQQERLHREERESAEKIRREEAARLNLASFQDRLEDPIDRLGTNAFLPLVACRLHLIDLSRGGYKPGFGEMHVPALSRFDPTLAPRGVYERSGTGSPAALCAGE